MSCFITLLSTLTFWPTLLNWRDSRVFFVAIFIYFLPLPFCYYSSMKMLKLSKVEAASRVYLYVVYRGLLSITGTIREPQLWVNGFDHSCLEFHPDIWIHCSLSLGLNRAYPIGHAHQVWWKQFCQSSMAIWFTRSQWFACIWNRFL